MGWYFRRSVKFGPLRLNFSKSGVGYSYGVKGLRVGTGPRGPEGQWSYTVLKTFYGADGCAPVGNLIMDKKGNLYGGTVLGGAYGGGVVFELTP